MEYDSDAVEREYEVMTLRIVHRRRCTGFEESKDFPVRANDLIAGRYQVLNPNPKSSLVTSCQRSAHSLRLRRAHILLGLHRYVLLLGASSESACVLQAKRPSKLQLFSWLSRGSPLYAFQGAVRFCARRLSPRARPLTLSSAAPATGDGLPGICGVQQGGSGAGHQNGRVRVSQNRQGQCLRQG